MGNVFHRHVEHVCIKTDKSEKRNSSSDTDVDFIQKVVEELVDRIPEKSSTTLKTSSCRSSVSNEYGFALEQEDASKRYLDTDTDVTEYESAADTELSGKLSSSASLLTFSDQLIYEPKEETCSCSLSDSNRKLECGCSLKQTQSLGSIGDDVPLNNTVNGKEDLVLDTVHLDCGDVRKPFPPLNVQLSDTLSPTSSCASPDNNFVLVEEASNANFGTSDEGNSSCSLDFEIEQNHSELRNSASEADCINQNHWNVISLNQDIVSDTYKNHSEKYTAEEIRLENENTPIKELINYHIKEINTVFQETHASDKCKEKLEESIEHVISSQIIKEVDKALLCKTLEYELNRECATSDINKESELNSAKEERNSTSQETSEGGGVGTVTVASTEENREPACAPAEESRKPVPFPTKVSEEPTPFPAGIIQEPVLVSTAVNQKTVPVPVSVEVSQKTVSDPVLAEVSQEPVSHPIPAEESREPLSVLVTAAESQEPVLVPVPILAEESRELAPVQTEASRESVPVSVPVPTEKSRELASVQAEVSGDTTAVPAEVTGDTTAVPAEVTGDTTAVPAEVSGDTTSFPGEVSGVTTSVPAEVTGDTTSVPAEVSGDTTSVPTEVSGDTTSVPAEVSGDTTSVIAEVSQGSVSVIKGKSTEPVVVYTDVINETASDIRGINSELFLSEINSNLKCPADLSRELAVKVSSGESHACEERQVIFGTKGIGAYDFTEIKNVDNLSEKHTDLEAIKGSKSSETVTQSLHSDTANCEPIKGYEDSLKDSNKQPFRKATQKQETEFNLQFKHKDTKTNKVIPRDISEEENEEPICASNKKQNWVSSCENSKEENKYLFSGSPEKLTSIHDISPVSNLGSSLFDSFGDQSSSSCAETTKGFPDLEIGKTSQSENLALYVSDNFSFVAAEASRIAEDIFNALEDLDSDDTISKEFKMSSLGDIDSDLDSNYPKSQCDETSNSLPQNYYLDGDSDTSISPSSLLTKKSQDDILKENSCKTRRPLEINNSEVPSKLKDSSSGECTGGNVDENTKASSDLKKESLYNKLDNLVDVVNHSSSQSYLEDDSLTSDRLDDNENTRTSLQKDELRNSSNKNQALEFVDRLLNLTSTTSPRNRSANSVDDTQQKDSKIQESTKNSVSPNMSNLDSQKLNQLREVILQQELIHKEEIKKYHRRMKSLEEREQQLGRKMMENSQGQQQMSLILEEYEKTISRLVAEKEHERQSYDLEKENLMKEKDAVSGHLSNIEIAFSDVHQKYEKSKQVIQGFKNNEEALRATVSDYEIALKKQEQKYEILKSHAMNQLESANQELIAMRRTHETENSKLKAMLKKAEVKIHSLEETLQQKIKENQELVNICDELIGKVGSND